MTLLPHLYRHHKWANLALIDHLAALPEEHLQRRAPGGFGTIQETLFHYIANEARFLDALNGKAMEFAHLPSEMPSCQEMRVSAAKQGDDLISLASSLSDADRLTGTFNGTEYDMPAFLPLFQAYAHAVEHRTNITTILRIYDIPTPPLDLWAFQEAGEAP